MASDARFKKPRERENIMFDPKSLYLTNGKFATYYAGPGDFYKMQPDEIVPLHLIGLSYNYDLAMGRYRLSLHRQLFERRAQLVVKIKELTEFFGGDLGIGMVFNGKPLALNPDGSEPNVDRRGLWFPHCAGACGGLHVTMDPVVVDIVSMGCDEPIFWAEPPVGAEGTNPEI